MIEALDKAKEKIYNLKQTKNQMTNPSRDAKFVPAFWFFGSYLVSLKMHTNRDIPMEKKRTLTKQGDSYE
jgi:hypothetical protein